MRLNLSLMDHVVVISRILACIGNIFSSKLKPSSILTLEKLQMRKIEEQMISAIHSQKRWSMANTIVSPIDDTNVAVYLHGHEIAIVNTYNGFTMTNVDTLRRYPTNTTKSRLRALGVNVVTRKGITYLDNVAI